MASKYIIICQARTGSTMLASALSDHPEICAHGEVFGMGDAHLNFWGINYEKQPPLIDSLRKFRNAEPRRFLREFVLNPGIFKSVGFKFKFEELSQPMWAAAVEEIAADRSLKILFLQRENLWRRFLSEYVAVHVTKMFNTTDKRYEQPDISIDIPIPLIEKAFRRSRRWERNYSRMFARHDRLDLSYEMLSRNYDGRIKQVQSFLNVPRRDVRPSTVKLSEAKSKTVIKNLEEIQKHFASTEFGPFFTPSSGSQ